MKLIKVFDKNKQSKTQFFETVLAKYQKKNPTRYNVTCTLMNQLEQNYEFLKSISRNFKPFNCSADLVIMPTPNLFGHYHITRNENYFDCTVDIALAYKLTFTVEVYFPSCIRISNVRVNNTAYFDDKKIIYALLDNGLILIQRILASENELVSAIKMQLNFLYRGLPDNFQIADCDINAIRDAYYYNIAELYNYSLNYKDSDKVIDARTSFYTFTKEGIPGQFLQEDFDAIDFGTKLSKEALINYELAMKLLADNFNNTYKSHPNFKKIVD